MTELVETADERQAEPLRVLLVDDHDLFRTGLRNLLEEQGLSIVGEAATGAVPGRGFPVWCVKRAKSPATNIVEWLFTVRSE